MRNPKRIKRICKLLEESWLLLPDQRLGQFLSNYVYRHHVDIFYINDKKVEKDLKDFMKKTKEMNAKNDKTKN